MDSRSLCLASVRPRRRVSSRRAGFTLLEAIVAIVMFTFIVMALSQAFNVALQATKRTQSRQLDDGSVRAIFDVITRDILAAYPSMNSPVSIFTTGGSGITAGPGDILTFSALSTRLQTPELDSQSTTGPQPLGSQGDSQPQSDMGLVKYNFDGGTGTLYRIISTVPSTQTLSTIAPTQDMAIAQNIQNIKLEFWDQTQQNWRPDWDYEQQNQIGVVPLSAMTSDTAAPTPSSSTTGAGGTTASQGTANTTATGDTYLPTAVRVTVTVVKSDGQTQDYVTTIPLGVTQAYLDPNQIANVNTTPLTSGTTSSTPTP